MIDNAKLDELLALADDMPPGPYHVREIEGNECAWWTPARENNRLLDSEDEARYFAACDPDTIRALVEEVKEAHRLLAICRDYPREEDAERIGELEREIQRLNARIICEDCGEISDDHEWKEVISKDDEPVRFADEPSPCSRSLCKDCGQGVHGR